MKKPIQIITAIVLIVAILGCSIWYLFVYDREFTRDMLLGCARSVESTGNHNMAAWFYNLAYAQSDDGDDVAIELAQQYKKSGNYTKAEYTLYQAIINGGGIDVWLGSLADKKVNAIICTVDLMKKDSEIKLLIGCTEEEMNTVHEFHNDSEFMKGIIIRR